MLRIYRELGCCAMLAPTQRDSDLYLGFLTHMRISAELGTS